MRSLVPKGFLSVRQTGIYLWQRKVIKLISGVLNKRKSKKDIDALEPKPALMYCCISII